MFAKRGKNFGNFQISLDSTTRRLFASVVTLEFQQSMQNREIAFLWNW